MKKTLLILAFALFTSANCLAQQEGFIGEVKLFAGNFAPRGWAFCEGQLLPISQNSALFSILGTTYGGDGRTTFGLPDLRGRSPIGPGNGPGLSSIRQGEKSGRENHTLSILDMPSHNHLTTVGQGTVSVPVNTISGDNDETSPAAGILSNTGDDLYTTSTSDAFYSGQALPTTGTTVTVLNNGGNQSHNIRNPYLGVHYIIALQGVFPSRN
jgi:microcystin-dependent protein